MVLLWVRLIEQGVKTIDDVPNQFKAAVLKYFE